MTFEPKKTEQFYLSPWAKWGRFAFPPWLQKSGRLLARMIRMIQLRCFEPKCKLESVLNLLSFWFFHLGLENEWEIYLCHPWLPFLAQRSRILGISSLKSGAQLRFSWSSTQDHESWRLLWTTECTKPSHFHLCANWMGRSTWLAGIPSASWDSGNVTSPLRRWSDYNPIYVIHSVISMTCDISLHALVSNSYLLPAGTDSARGSYYYQGLRYPW